MLLYMLDCWGIKVYDGFKFLMVILDFSEIVGIHLKTKILNCDYVLEALQFRILNSG